MPAPSEPLTRSASPRGSVNRLGFCTATSVCGNSFHALWNDRMVSVITAGRAIGRITDQNVRNGPAPSMRAASSTLTGIDSKNCFMMNTPAASTRSGRISAV